VSEIVLLAQDCTATRAICHAVGARFGAPQIVLEKRVSRHTFLRNRVRKLGIVSVAGQVLFAALGAPLLRRTSARRIAEIERVHGLRSGALRGPVTRVPSVNSRQAREALQRLEPKVVVVSGTRIIARETLTAVRAPFINLHAGITPLYRGVHGGYWALVDGRPDLVGTTIHLVTEGVDSGPVLARATFQVTEADSFATYPYLHTAVGLPALLAAVERALSGSLQPIGRLALQSRVRYHPTLWGYLLARRRLGVR
jgi:phosphoribosylglycinamide formyltransferase-1